MNLQIRTKHEFSPKIPQNLGFRFLKAANFLNRLKEQTFGKGEVDSSILSGSTSNAKGLGQTRLPRRQHGGANGRKIRPVSHEPPHIRPGV